MNKVNHILAVLVLLAGPLIGMDAWGTEPESPWASLDRRLEEYFAAIEREPVDVRKGECDFLIETCTDSLMRQHVALTIFGHFRDSRLMGDESVAIHVFDRWFDSGLVRMKSDADMIGARVFAEFNRRSLIGMRAPQLDLVGIDGEPVSLYSDTGKRYSILYFYDTDCPSCKVQTILLRNMLEDEDFPVDLYAVYADDDAQAWLSYIDGQLQIEAPHVSVIHGWDPGFESDFQRKYGVVQTPRMFLVSPEGIIIGRSLDAAALSQLLHSIYDDVELSYGGRESEELYDRIFGDGRPSLKDVADVADHISSVTLAKGDTVMFRQLTGDMLYYLSSRKGEGYREGLDYLIDRYILPRNDVWRSGDDSLKIVGMARMFDDLLSKSVPGTRIPGIRLPGTVISSGRSSTGEFNLRKLRGRRNIIMFVTGGCSVCAAEKEAAAALARSEKGVRVLMVDVDDVLYRSPALANRLFDEFDLSSLPFIIETDRKGVILRRYVSLVL